MSIGINASQAFSPNKITGLKLWLDASDLSAIIESGGLVSQWNDKSGNGSHAVQLIMAEQPFTGLRTLGIHNVIDFQSAQFMELDSQPIVGTQARTIIIVGFADDGANSNTFVSLTSDSVMGSQYRIQPEISVRINGASQLFEDDSFESGISAILTTTQGEASSLEYDVANLQMYKNGLLLTSPDSSNPETLVDTSVGTAIIAGASLNGVLAEFIIYDKVLSTLERQQVESYLTAKWRI